MDRQKSVKDFKTASLETFALPDDFSIKLQELEIALYEGDISHNTLKELFELYTVKIFSEI